MPPFIISQVQSILRDKFCLCESCAELYIGGPNNKMSEYEENNHNTSPCLLCLGLLSNKNNALLGKKILAIIEDKIRPYRGISGSICDIQLDSSQTRISCSSSSMNCISKDSPTVVLPNCILLVAHTISCSLGIIIEKEMKKMAGESTSQFKVKSAIEIYNQIKERIRVKVKKLIIQVNNENNMKVEQQIGCHNVWGDEESITTSCLQQEEAGYLKFHMIVTPDLSFPYLPCNDAYLPLPKLSTKRDRKRFRGNDPLPKQGGDPRANLFAHVKIHLSKSLEEIINRTELEMQERNDEKTSYLDSAMNAKLNHQCCLLEKNVIVKYLETTGSTKEIKEKLFKWAIEILPSLRKQHLPPQTIEPTIDNVNIHFTCWRNHFYLKGKYTKSRRDVSQTPFYVANDEIKDETIGGNLEPNEKHKMKRLGISSVEEEICPVICDIACNGISKNNNEPIVSNQNGNVGGSSSNLVYGMCKFHASGREDIDVRMILPPDILDGEDCSASSEHNKGSGRPFVCEIIDAHKLPTNEDLIRTVRAVNHDASSILKVTVTKKSKWVDENDRTHVQYGQNPNGVGISGLSYCLSSSYSNLQCETENKVKFYGCLCWSEAVIPNQIFLENKLIRGGDIAKAQSLYPLTIEQCTPLRVLHRRSADRRIRHVLSLRVNRIDNHWFRVHLSTSAGTYVKEFCHGDCGRTKPSISSLLGCKTDILELDCEGIAF